MSYLADSSFNDKQIEAINCTQGPLLVLAGAGTGKTKVLTGRIAHIIEQNLAEPYNILAVTFTNKAAKEMEARINNLINAQGLNIGTFHSIASRMLRAHIELLALKINRNFTIIDQDDQIKLVKNICLQENIDVKKYSPKMLHSIISRWKDQGLIHEQLSSSDISSPSHGKAAAVYAHYQKQMQSSNVMDFGDLLLYCNKLFIDNPEILGYYQNKFKYILIDEYQDTNAIQYVWVRRLADKHKNICCVGDDDQSIYSWRGADIENILRFERDFRDAQIIKLEQNYRSTPYILSVAAEIISNNENRHDKKLWTDKLSGEKIKIVSCWSEKEEARWVVTEIARYINAGKYTANNVAILVRAGFQTRSFEEVLISNAIPYQIIGGLRFYERMEIRDILAYIRLSVNHEDSLAFERIINIPRRSIGNVTLQKMKDFAFENEISVFEALTQMLNQQLIKGKAAESLTSFIRVITNAGIKYKTESASEVTKFVLTESRYLAALKEENTEESRTRIENINEMLKAIEEFDNILEFIEHTSLVMDNDSLESGFGGAVKIMTLHASKGLEFDLVFLPGWEENLFPHQRSIMEGGLKGLEEERRIAYVGVTRAKKELIITHAENRRIFWEFSRTIPSRFIKEIPDHLCINLSANNKVNYLESRHSFSMQETRIKPVNAQASNNYLHEASMSAPQIQKGKVTGSKITHPKFGFGVIIKKNGDSLEIAFEKLGIRTIKEDYVDLVVEKF